MILFLPFFIQIAVCPCFGVPLSGVGLKQLQKGKWIEKLEKDQTTLPTLSPAIYNSIIALLALTLSSKNTHQWLTLAWPWQSALSRACQAGECMDTVLFCIFMWVPLLDMVWVQHYIQL